MGKKFAIHIESISPNAVGTIVNKTTILKTISDALSKVSGQSAPQIQSAFMEREGVGNTALESGIVIPHAVLDGRQVPVLGVLSYPRRVKDWKDLNGQPVTQVLAILMGKDEITEQEANDIKRFFVKLASSDFLRKIARSKDSQTVVAVIKQQMEEE
ncbi:MAG: PTS sugar transporter subunit IIA [Enterococcus sp.]|uniref:PTS sugar transporter subunit IIA n=1 Tax=Enterococcus sp. TaxID=35783 RepID=UPI002648F4CB|nr:PTS sugar transporter subunit IIA [Enterococcus sp.]MDN6217790.1 PTS sugar transporter subunit IIA [Enterococcus sp.]MDN6691648.1 PTS sugar transporter subunit IIA [Enterococcus sp.]